MRRRGMILFLLLNVLVSVGVAFGIISTFGSEGGEAQERLVTFVVFITPSPDPDATEAVRVVTATPEPGRANIPADVREGAGSDPFATIDPELLDADGNFIGSSASLPENCIVHTVSDGEFPSLIAQTYDVNMFTLMAVNRLDEVSATNLQIGDELIIPLEGCPLENFIASGVSEDDADEDDERDAIAALGDAESTEEPEVAPTVTLAPTAQNAQVEIVEVIGAGDITTESIRISNTGNTVDITGWTLSNAEGETFTFPQQRLFSGASITVNSRAGERTSILFFWGRDEAVFSNPDDVIILANAAGVVQASVRVSDLSELDLP